MLAAEKYDRRTVATRTDEPSLGEAVQRDAKGSNVDQSHGDVHHRCGEEAQEDEVDEAQDEGEEEAGYHKRLPAGEDVCGGGGGIGRQRLRLLQTLQQLGAQGAAEAQVEMEASSAPPTACSAMDFFELTSVAVTDSAAPWSPVDGAGTRAAICLHRAQVE